MRLRSLACMGQTDREPVAAQDAVNRDRSRKRMMRKLKTTFLALAAIVLLTAPPGPAMAQGGADCSSAAARVVAQTRGQLLSVLVARQGNQTVCRVTVLTSDQTGKRRQKKTVVVRP